MMLVVGRIYFFFLFEQFKENPDKKVNISDFSVVLLDDPRHPDTFQLTDDIKGTVFAFNVSFLVLGGFKIINDIYN